MKVNKSLLAVLSMFLILLLFVSSASAADTNETNDVLSVDESSNTINEKLALDYSLDNAVANDTNDVENNENILAILTLFGTVTLFIHILSTHTSVFGRDARKIRTV